MIELGELYIESNDSLARLCCPISVNSVDEVIWLEVDSEFSKYLCNERSDAFIVALLNYAMLNKYDITFKTAISQDLFFNLTQFVIPTLSKTGKSFHAINLIGEVSSTLLPTKGGVGTGISAGIDSLQVIASLTEDNILDSFRISHLAFNNVGSHGEGERAKCLFEARRQKAKDFCLDYGYTFVESNSNIHDLIKQNHYLTHTYTSCFAVLGLQKLYSKYYYASSIPLESFSFEDSDINSPGHYEYFLLSSFSVNLLKIYSVGANLSRLDKTMRVSKYLASYKYLNVCTESATNCGKCEKCMRTLLTLDAIDKLNLYNKVFDIDEYRKHPFKNKVFMCRQLLHGKEDYVPLKSLINVNLMHYLMALMINTNVSLYSRVRRYLPNRLIVFLKYIFR